MNLSTPLMAPTKVLYKLALKSRIFLPRQRCHTFGRAHANLQPTIERIYVINLDRQTKRWNEMHRELGRVLDSTGTKLSQLAVRYSAVDARNCEEPLWDNGEIVPAYTLRDQLLVEPQPDALPERVDFDRTIPMSRPEIAVALSHVGVWQQIANGEHAYALVVEDDVWFQRGFARYLDRAWSEIHTECGDNPPFDILYLSYKEVKNGAQKTLVSNSVFRPVRGLWYMSGYVLSRDGAKKLLELLPCRGPVDLWINHQFDVLNVCATRRSIIRQRHDFGSSNSYSILPELTKIGVLDCEGESLFQIRPNERPVFAFGPEGSGLSSLAMALSMLGYRCCSDLDELPEWELKQLLAGSADRVFDAYVNIGSLRGMAKTLLAKYPRAKFVITTNDSLDNNGCAIDFAEEMKDCDAAVLSKAMVDKWKVVCEHLKCAPPTCSFPDVDDVGQRQLLSTNGEACGPAVNGSPRHDPSPWVVEHRKQWSGVRCKIACNGSDEASHVNFEDKLENLDKKRWVLRDDTFSGNLALFCPSNVELLTGGGAELSVKSEPLGVRNYSAASISSRDKFLFGRFEVVLQASKVPGVVTGFFLHRDSPRQEIDIEIVGNRSDHVLVNVFYNPGGEGARFDYGYRGSPSSIKLGFDAAESPHRFAIEWDPCEIRWLVDGQIIHQRANWDPTPIPQLPMTLHVNTWPTRSKELAGRLARRRLPTSAVVRSIDVRANRAAQLDPSWGHANNH